MKNTMTRLLALFLPIAFVAAACGSDASTEAGTATTVSEHGDDHGDDHGDGGAMDDGAVEGMEDTAGGHEHGDAIDVSAIAPTVAIEAIPDPAGGVNIAVTSTNHEVSAAAASTEHVEGQGHYHLFVDGERRSRFYNDWVHVPGVDAGSHEFMVSLSANDHSDLAVDGNQVMAMATVEVPEHAHDDHGHGEAEPQEAAGISITDLTVTEDPKSGWNLNVAWNGVAMAPENVSGDHIDGEGHLHVLVNGEKLARIYGADMHIAALPDGDVTISVAAFTNDHRPYTVDGAPAQTSTSISVQSA